MAPEDLAGIPIVSVVGKSNVGKTTLLEKLIAELKQRGYRVGTIKHDVHGFDIDHPGKDSWRLAQAGSDAVVIASPQKLALIKRLEGELSLDEVASYIPDVDIILTEGYKRADKPKIEVYRQGVGDELLCSSDELVAVVTDVALDIPVPQFDLNDVSGLADFIEEKFLKHRSHPRVSVLVDGKGVPIFKEFTRNIIARTIKGMASALHGGEGQYIVIKVDYGKAAEEEGE
ncbi:MAG: molybdopterin-guanine dinucleotide biosynthesis protein B [Chloroflexi bacterium]|nr:MAG: molybdopterin-guanine dinucleotide biosynthesis protein B [Chloroflexota bacterium]